MPFNVISTILGNRSREKTSSREMRHAQSMFGKETSRMREFWDKESQRIDKAHWRDREFFDKSQKNVLDQITLGNQLDMSNQKEMFDYRINQGIQAGMTPYEMFMGPAAGAGGGTTGSGNTLGNSQSQRDQQMMTQSLQREENMADRELALMQAKLQAQTQIGQAQIAADASKYQANASLLGNAGATIAGMRNVDVTTANQRHIAHIQNEIEQGRLELDKKTYENVTLPGAAATIGKTKKETDKIVNEIVTSTPEFVRQMKKWSMGVDNMMVEYFSATYGVDITDPDSIKRIPKQMRKDFLTAVMAFQSTLGKEMAGVKMSDALQGIGTTLGNSAGAVTDFFAGRPFFPSFKNEAGNKQAKKRKLSRR